MKHSLRSTLTITLPFALAAALGAACSGSSNPSGATESPTPTQSGTSTPTPTGTSTPVLSCSATCDAPFTCDTSAGLCKNQGVPQFKHVWIVVLENTNYDNITTSAAPYVTGTLYPQGVQMTNYWAVTHPSLPNYIAMVGGDNFGITADGTASDPAYQIAASHPNIASQLEAANMTWHEYSESQTSACQLGDSGSDSSNSSFTSKHNPMTHFLVTQGTQSCAANDVSFDPQGTMPGLAADLAAHRSFNYNFISPNMCDDGHDLCFNVAYPQVTAQDNFLSHNLSTILDSPEYQDNGLVIVTWDENDDIFTSSSGQIATVYLSPLLAHPGTTNGTKYTHYSMLSTVEAGFGLVSLPAANGHNDALITDIWK